MPFPKINYRWSRDWREHNYLINWKLPQRILALGIIGSAKSSLLEVCGTRYPKIVDILGSVDGESLCWGKPEFTKLFEEVHNRPPEILFVIGRNIKISTRFDCLHVDELNLKTMEDYDIITTAQLLHQTAEDCHRTMAKIVNVLESRLFWHEAWCLLIREAANWAYARMKIFKDADSAKADLVEFYRESRHHGLAVFMDTLRWTDIDKVVRDMSTYIFVKRTGSQRIPDDLSFCLKHWYYRDSETGRLKFGAKAMRWLPRNMFGIKSIEGAIGVGWFERPEWHKEENEDIKKSVGFEVEFEGEIPKHEKFKSISDLKHSEIVQARFATNEKGKRLSLADIAARVNCSIVTVKLHVDSHDNTVAMYGECDKCKMAKSDLSKVKCP